VINWVGSGGLILTMTLEIQLFSLSPCPCNLRDGRRKCFLLGCLWLIFSGAVPHGSEDTVSCAEVAERGVLRRTAAAPAGVRSCCFVQRPRRHTTAREGAVSGCCVRQCFCAPRWTAARPRGGRADGHRRGACLHRALRSSYLRSLNCGLVCTGQTLKQHFSSTSPCSPQCERPR